MFDRNERILADLCWIFISGFALGYCIKKMIENGEIDCIHIIFAVANALLFIIWLAVLAHHLDE